MILPLLLIQRKIVGYLEMVIDIDFIVETTHIPFERDKWSKNCIMCDIPSKKLIVSKDCGYHVKGMPISSLKSKCRNLVLFLHQYTTCE